MAAGPVTEAAPPLAQPGPPSWKLAAPHDAMTQGMVVSGFGHLKCARALFLEFAWKGSQKGGAWLQALQAVAPITDADGKEERAAALAFTWTGLKTMGLDPTALASFSRPFQEGMLQEDRLRRLGDRWNGEWLPSVIKDGPVWSGNTPQFEVGGAPSEAQVTTKVTVHALLIIYEASNSATDAWRDQIAKTLAAKGVNIVRELPLDLDPNNLGIVAEHFGFADGLSQPTPFDENGAVLLNGQPATAKTNYGAPLGEFLIGHVNGHHEKAPGPVVPDATAKDSSLPQDDLAEGFRTLGLDGSYMVVRELRQDVAAFWTSMKKNAAAIQAQDPKTSGHVTDEWLAERVIGRGADGHLLCPLATPNLTKPGYLNPDKYGLPDNDFLFRPRDPVGIGCPAGSHARRANPRDTLAPSPAMAQTLLDAANNHRILRRARKYGPGIADRYVDDGKDRGLLFMALNTDIARQFEFVQQTWLLNANFNTLFDETDPLVGPAGPMTIRDTPLRRIAHVDTFVRLAGGDYFFLPSLPAIDYLATLP